MRVGKRETAYAPDSNLNDVLALQILFDVSVKALRGALLRPRLRSCGSWPLVGKHVRVTNPQLITCGYGLVIEDGADLQGLSVQGLVFGNNVTVARGAHIRPSGYYGRDVGKGLRVGDNSNIGAMCYIGASGGIEIGRNVLMGPSVILLSEEHNIDGAVEIKKQGIRHAPTKIGDGAWIGARAVILGGVRVGAGAVVAAGAVVTKDVADNTVVAGVPARVVRERVNA